MSEAVAEATQAEPLAATQDVGVTEPATELLDNLALLEDGAPATQDAESTEPADAGTEPEAVEDEVEELKKSVAQRAAEEARAEQKAQDERERYEEAERAEYTRRLEGIDQSYRQRAPAIRNLLTNLLGTDISYQVGENNVTGKQIVDWVLNEFNTHHATAGSVVTKQFFDYMSWYASQNLSAEAAKEFQAEYQGGKLTDQAKVLDAFITRKVKDAQTGHFTQSQVKEQVDTEKLKLIRRFQTDETYRERVLSGRNGAQSRANGATATGSDDERLLNPNTPITEINQILARRNGQ